MTGPACPPRDDPAPAIQLSWVLPLYRTAQQIDELLARIAQVSARLGISHEVILVDDACPEGCGALADAAASLDSRIQVLHQPFNQGQDVALRAGLRCSRGAWAVILDADLQDPPEAIDRLWLLRHRAGVVFARRTGRYSSRGRRLTSQAYRAAFALIGGLPYGACLYALLERPVIERINACGDDRIALLVLIARATETSTCTTIQRSRRPAGNSSYTSLDRSAKAIRSLWQLFFARLFNRAFQEPRQP